MKRSAFLFFKALGLLFAILVGIGTAVLGWLDAADWINIVFYSMATTALVLWGWYHFSIRWIHSDLKQIYFLKFRLKKMLKQTKQLRNQMKAIFSMKIFFNTNGQLADLFY